MSQASTGMAGAEVAERRAQLLGHPAGLFLLFFVEMWERFSYYGMRGLLVLYLTSPESGARVPPPGSPVGFNPGPGWGDTEGNTAYGWYTGLCYLTPIMGGLIADKFIGTHRSMLVGGLLIALGHIMLGTSGLGAVAGTPSGMTLFVFGLGLIIIGTGHFKPCVSVMVGQLYDLKDPRRETAFGIFYMGINLGAALQTYIVGTLGETVGWHWGFGAAAVGMLTGLAAYVLIRPRLLAGIGLPNVEARGRLAPVFLPIGVVVAGVGALLWRAGILTKLDVFVSQTWVIIVLALAAIGWALWFLSIQEKDDRGPVASILIFMLFNAVFWLSFEQAGSSINIFTDRDTDRLVTPPGWLSSLSTDGWFPYDWAAWAIVGLLASVLMIRKLVNGALAGRVGAQVVGLTGGLVGLAILAIGILKGAGLLGWVATFQQIPTTWFQSVNPWLIIAFAPVTGVMWTALARRKSNPSQPTKIGIGLLGVGLGYLFLIWGAMTVKDGHKAAMFFVVATYFVHTMGEIVLSPTGLSYVTKAAPRKYVSLLMGMWFLSSFIANLLAGKVAAMTEPILEGQKTLPWHLNSPPETPNTMADFFLLFTVTSCAAAVLIFILLPWLKKLIHGREG